MYCFGAEYLRGSLGNYMPVSKHRKIASKRKSKKKVINNNHPSDMQPMVLMEHPFNNVPREELLNAIQSRKEKSAKSFPQHLANLQKFVRTFEPVTTLSTLAFYGLFTGVDERGQTRENSTIRQDQIELLQAFYMQVPHAELGQELAEPENIQSVIDELSGLTNAYSNRDIAIPKKNEGKRESSEKHLQSFLRGHTQVVRNWAFFDHAIDLAKRLLKPLDNNCEQLLGLSASAIIDLFSFIMRRTEKRITNHIKNMRMIRNESSIQGIVNAYYRAYPYLQQDPEELITYFTVNKLPISDVKFRMLTKMDEMLPLIFYYSCDEVAIERNIDAITLDAVFKKLSIGLGDIVDKKIEHIFLDNPVWYKPLISLGERVYLCPIPALFSGYLFRIFESLIEHDENLKERYWKVRAKFLEQEVYDLFKNAFPICQIEASYKWGGYENDLLVGIDNNLFIIEDKSNKQNPAALRGGKESAIKHINNVIIEPSVQSLRLQNRIINALEAPDKTDELLPNFPFELRKIKYIYRLSVTLEDFATVQSNLRLAKEAGWLPKDHVFAPCILVTDLAIVFEMLELTALKIHYLKRRSEIQQHMIYIGHELNLLGLYMKSGFSLGEHGHNWTNMISEMSSDIDAYYTAKDAGFNPQKPRPRLHPYFRKVCQRLEDQEFEGWSTVAMVILSCPYEDQIKGLKSFQVMKLSVKNRWKDLTHLNSVLIIPDKYNSSEALILHAFKNENSTDLDQATRNLASSTFDNDHVTTALVISVNIDKPHLVYSRMTLFTKDGLHNSSYNPIPD